MDELLPLVLTEPRLQDTISSAVTPAPSTPGAACTALGVALEFGAAGFGWVRRPGRGATGGPVELLGRLGVPQGMCEAPGDAQLVGCASDNLCRGLPCCRQRFVIPP